MLNICLCFHDAGGSYHEHALTTLVSVFENTAGFVCAHIVSDETFSAAAREKFEALGERYGQGMRFYNASDALPQELLTAIPAHFGRGSFYRIALPDILPDDVETALYMDCDVIADTDIAPLFGLAAPKMLIGGALDPSILTESHDETAYMLRLGADPDCCVNSGVLLMNLKLFRQEHQGFKKFALEMLQNNELRFPDQDVISCYISRHKELFLKLPENYNLCVGYKDRGFRRPEYGKGKLIHYTGPKPWNYDFPMGIFYWKYKARLHPAHEVFSLMENLREDRRQYLYRFILGDNKELRRLRRRMQLCTKGLWQTLLDRIFPARRKKRGEIKTDSAVSSN